MTNCSGLMHAPAKPFGVSSARKKDWALTSGAFVRFLWALDTDRERAGDKYEQIRGHLMKFFARRGCPFPEDHADETIDRVARRIAEGEEIKAPSHYVRGVARILALEIGKRQRRERVAIQHLPAPDSTPEGSLVSPPQRARFESSLRRLSPEARELILKYYDEDKRARIDNRKRLAEEMGIALNALRIRVHRIRMMLVRRCMDRSVQSR